MSTPDDDLKEFFADMQREDSQSPIPEFAVRSTNQPRSRKLVFTVLGLAASVLIAVFFFRTDEAKPADAKPAELVISFSNEKQASSAALISNESVDSWKPSSDYLLNDF